jgi:hypothetical protein
MEFNEWAKYTGVGSTCEYDDRTKQFIEQYNNATFQTYMDNERKNRAIQRATQARQKGWQVLPSDSEWEDNSVLLHSRQPNKKVHSPVLRWVSLVVDELRECIRAINK